MTTVEETRRRLSWWQESALLLGIALMLAVVIKTFLAQAFYIPSDSMEPGFVKDDRILVQKVSYWFGGTPQRGDIIVFEDPGDWLPAYLKKGPPNPVAQAMAAIGLYPTGGHLVKRVIGVAGDVVTCCDDGRIAVNGTPLDEDAYIAPQRDCNGPMTGTCDWTAGPVPEGHLFVMGDNRGESADSSFHMCRPGDAACLPGDEFVSVHLVVGRVLALLWPPDHARLVHRPDSFADVPDPG